MNQKLLQYGKIILILVFSFAIIRVFAPLIFLSNTPRYNSQFIAQIQESIINNVNKQRQYLASFFNSKTEPSQMAVKNNNIANNESAQPFPSTTKPTQLAPDNFNPAQVVFSQLSKGVYAGEDKITKKKYIKFDNNVKVNVTEYDFGGKKIYLYEPEVK